MGGWLVVAPLVLIGYVHGVRTRCMYVCSPWGAVVVAALLLPRYLVLPCGPSCRCCMLRSVARSSPQAARLTGRTRSRSNSRWSGSACSLFIERACQGSCARTPQSRYLRRRITNRVVEEGGHFGLDCCLPPTASCAAASPTTTWDRKAADSHQIQAAVANASPLPPQGPLLQGPVTCTCSENGTNVCPEDSAERACARRSA